jgi:mevalonate kinase
MSKKSFYSNGKLLLTGEYTVLDGAKALALPCKFGQALEVEENTSGEISWESYDVDQTLWLKVTFKIQDLLARNILSEDSAQSRLANILIEAAKLNPSFLEINKGYTVKTTLTFPRNWGLGTSSTLITNIAQWLSIDPYELLRKTFGGSGYDIACAQSNSPILYQLESEKPIVTSTFFSPEFSEHLYFVYLNKKQNSRAAIAGYYAKRSNIGDVITAINKISEEVLASSDLAEFIRLMNHHEKIMSEVLGLNTVKEELFSDFEGSVKSLGAWGGDFVLVITEKNPALYFNKRGFQTVIPYQEMIL